jgi:iron complex transport system permease protein
MTRESAKTGARESSERRHRASLLISLLLVISVALALLGSLDLWWPLIWPQQETSSDFQLMLFEVRLPRIIGAWAAGACLGLGGALAQSLFRNPLADPYLVGSASGAGLGVTLSLVLLGAVRVELAFAGALLAVTLAVVLSQGRDTLLLGGFVISIVLSALVAILLVKYPEHLRVSQLFMLGQTHLLDWVASQVMLPALGLCLIISVRLAKPLEAMSLGDATAQSLGIPITQLRWILIAVIALLSAVSVAYCGMLAFVGLGAAHIVRELFRTSVQNRLSLQLVLSALAGGILLEVSDLIARVVFWPTEMPVGVITALLGGAYLLSLLFAGRSGLR